MQITVSGKQIDIGQALQEHVETRLRELIEKYLDRVTDAMVVFSKESHLFRADIIVNSGTGTHARTTIKGQAESDEIYSAFGMAADKVEKQLRRYKSRLKDHHKTKPHPRDVDEARIMATKYVLSSGNEEEESQEENPLVIAEKSTEIETLTVSQAVMKMDLADLPALMFFNRAHGGLNVVYRRKDGNISWVDPKDNSEQAA